MVSSTSRAGTEVLLSLVMAIVNVFYAFGIERFTVETNRKLKSIKNGKNMVIKVEMLVR